MTLVPPGTFKTDLDIKQHWLIIACILSTFDIRLKKDAAGIDIPINLEYTSSSIRCVLEITSIRVYRYGIDSGTYLRSHPRPFKCEILPRSKAAERIIREAVGNIG